MMIVQTIEQMNKHEMHQIMLDAFYGKTHLLEQERYIVIRISSWIFYSESVEIKK